MICIRIMNRSSFLPPMTNSIHSELGGIPACTNANKALVAAKVVDAVRNGNTLGIGRKIMVQNPDGLLTPNSARVIKRPDQLPTFGVHTDDGKPIHCKILNLGSNVSKLLISFARRWRIFQAGLQAFQIHSKGKVHFLEKPTDGFGRDFYTRAFDLFRDFARRFSRPAVSYFMMSAILFMI